MLLLVALLVLMVLMSLLVNLLVNLVVLVVVGLLIGFLGRLLIGGLLISRGSYLLLAGGELRNLFLRLLELSLKVMVCVNEVLVSLGQALNFFAEVSSRLLCLL